MIKTLLITGGTGLFGNAVINSFLDTDIEEIPVPCDKRSLNCEKYFSRGDIRRNKFCELNSNNTELLTVEQTM
ncbi:MAG: hypothetical protein ACI4HJ_00410 [Ruminococcus sp.]